MSSMRNAVSRRPHKERSQPKGREKWGILEKHKDYSLRARDYNLKKQKLAALAQKARDKNEDEFAFAMLSASKAEAGKHGRRDGQANSLSHDAVKLLKSQDLGYLRVVAGKGRREISRLEEEVGMDKPSERGRKVVFVDEDVREQLRAGKSRRLGGERNEDEAQASSRPGMDASVNPDQAEPSAVKSTAPRSKKALAASRDALRDLRAARKRRKRRAELRVLKLEALKKRQREVMAAVEELQLQRAKMARTVGGVNKEGVKWKIRERKR